MSKVPKDCGNVAKECRFWLLVIIPTTFGSAPPLASSPVIASQVDSRSSLEPLQEKLRQTRIEVFVRKFQVERILVRGYDL